jgi:D-glycero-D-manno-heptose 1,7-bisphosphate phosphatase
MGNRALFLDRDGVINVDTGHPHKIEDIVFIDGIIDLILAAKSADAKIIVVTNQSGIGRGMYSEQEFRGLMAWMNAELKKHGASWDAYYFCPHVPDNSRDYPAGGCDCRKPKPGMILQAAKDFSIDLAKSILVGDSESDVVAGKLGGIAHCYLVGVDFITLRDLSLPLEFTNGPSTICRCHSCDQ